MTTINKQIILDAAARIYSIGGEENFSIRKLATEITIAPSVIYHYFENEEKLLREMFDYLNTGLGRKRSMLTQPKTAEQMLKQRIGFQLDNSDSIVAVLKYYLANRKNFEKNKSGFLPDNSTLHIEEVLKYGMKTGEFKLKNLKNDAQIITHAINGFLLEYYPYRLEEKEKRIIINKIFKFLIRALKGGEN